MSKCKQLKHLWRPFLWALLLVMVLGSCDFGLWGSECLGENDCSPDQVCTRGLCKTLAPREPSPTEHNTSEPFNDAADSGDAADSPGDAPTQDNARPPQERLREPFVPEQCSADSCAAHWFVKYGSPQTKQAGFALTQDSQGNTYVTGRDHNALFVLKLDPRGKVVWTFLSTERAGSRGYSAGQGIALDSKGNVLVAGIHGHNHEFAGKAYPLSDKFDLGDALVLKLTSAGKMVWATSGGGVAQDIANLIAINAQDQIVVVGRYSERSKFGTIELTPKRPLGGFVAKLDVAGKWLWATGTVDITTALIPSQKSRIYALTLGPSGDIYAAGIYSHRMQLGTIILEPNPSESGFLARLNSNGKWMWAETTKGAGHETPRSILIDQTGAVYLLFNFQQELIVGTLQAKTSTTGIAIAKIDPQRKWQWLVSSLDDGTHIGRNIKFGPSGSIFAIGEYQGSLTLGSFTIKSKNPASTNPFVAKLDSKGVAQWLTKAESTTFSDRLFDAFVDKEGSTFATGGFSSLMRLGTYTHTTPQNDPGDLFIFKLDPQGRFQ